MRRPITVDQYVERLTKLIELVQTGTSISEACDLAKIRDTKLTELVQQNVLSMVPGSKPRRYDFPKSDDFEAIRILATYCAATSTRGGEVVPMKSSSPRKSITHNLFKHEEPAEDPMGLFPSTNVNEAVLGCLAKAALLLGKQYSGATPAGFYQQMMLLKQENLTLRERIKELERFKERTQSLLTEIKNV